MDSVIGIDSGWEDLPIRLLPMSAGWNLVAAVMRQAESGLRKAMISRPVMQTVENAIKQSGNGFARVRSGLWIRSVQ